MGGQFVFFYAVGLLMAVRYPSESILVLCIYFIAVIRNIFTSWRRW